MDNNSGAQAFIQGWWLIPLIILVAVIGLFGITRYWQQMIGEALKPILPTIHRQQGRVNGIRRKLLPFSPDDPEPFGSRIAEIQERLARLDGQIQDFSKAYAQLKASFSRMRLGFWQSLVSSPFFLLEWYRLRVNVAALKDNVMLLEIDLGQVDLSMDEIERIGWQVAGRAREVLQLHRKVSQDLINLQKRNMRGDAIEAVESRLQQLLAGLERIPVYFYTSYEGEVLTKADKAEIIAAHGILSGAQPELVDFDERIQGWERRYQETKEKVVEMHSLVQEVSQLIETMPAELALEEYRSNLKPLTQISDSLQQTLERLEVESIAEVQHETARVHKAALEISNQLRKARRQLIALEPLLEEISGRLIRLSELVASLGTNRVRPLIWEESQSRFMDLNQRFRNIGTREKRRTPEDVQEDLLKADELNNGLSALEKRFHEVMAHHKDLLSALASIEIRRGLDLCRSLQRLAVQVDAYDPENWPKVDGVNTLSMDIQSLIDQHQGLIPKDLRQPIKESALPGYLESVQNLLSSYRDLRGRVEHIQARLAEIQDSENRARDRLEEANSCLTQVAFLAGSNAYLGQLATSDIARFRASVTGLKVELERRERGIIAEKARRVEALLGQIEEAGNRWIHQLNREIEDQKRELAEDLVQLDGIAIFEERAIQEAQELLSVDVIQSMALKSGTMPEILLEELLSQLKPRSDYWQACTAARKRLEEVKEPVLGIYQQVMEQRQMIHGLIAQLDQEVGKRTWPPCSSVKDIDRQEFIRLEEKITRLKSEPTTALMLVRQFGELSSGYQGLMEKYRLAEERAEQERARIRDIEARLTKLSRQWLVLEQTYGADAMIANEIRRLRAQVDREVEGLKRQWLAGPTHRFDSLSYDQLYQTLVSLCRDVEKVHIVVRDGQEDRREIGIQGEVHPDRWRF